jgi:hypothetical protein
MSESVSDGPAPALAVDLGALGLDAGADILLARALARGGPGARVDVRGSAPDLAVHLPAWCRAKGHNVVTLARELAGVHAIVEVGRHVDARRIGATRAGLPDPRDPNAIVEAPDPAWGLAARGALVEAGTAAVPFALRHKHDVWADEAIALYAQAAAAQWDPATAIPWDAEITHDDAIEDAIVQIMTYLVENETVALLVPARFLAQIHPHFREVLQVLAVQVADEARHIEVFTRRAQLRRDVLGTSSAGGQASLTTLLFEPDFAEASFLLSVLGEGTFLALLWFLHEHAPDPITRAVARLAAQDEARHVAFGLAHLQRHVTHDPALVDRLARAVERRHDALASTAGLNADVFDALVLVAAGGLAPSAIERGHAAVRALVLEMDRGRRRRLQRLGFDEAQATALSELHTRNFM